MTVDQIIATLGGAARISKRLGYRHRSRIANWRKTGIPASAWPVILGLAAEMEAELTSIDVDALRTANAITKKSAT